MARNKTSAISYHRENVLASCPDSGSALKKPVRQYQRIIEDLRAAGPCMTEHTIHGY
ncbi:MAG: hypothetical protein AB1641_02525 [Thermodesulfobacteriota bacterium]